MRAISNNISQVALKFFRKKGDEVEDISDAPEFVPLVSQPNPSITIEQYNEKYWGCLELTGEFYGELIRDKGGQLREIYPLRPDLMKVVVSERGKFLGYSQNVNGRRIFLELEDVLYVNYWNPTSEIRGLSPLVSATQTIITELQAITYNKSKLSEDVTPSGFYSAKEKLDQDEWDRVKKAFEDKSSGAKHAGKTLFLDADVSYETLSLSPKDMEYPNLRKLGKSEIREAYDVPPIFTGDYSDSSVLQNTEIQERGFWTHNLIPKLLKNASMINRFIKPMVTDDSNVWCAYDFSTVKALQKSEKDRLEANERRLGMGTITPNEMRIEDGRDTYTDGDKFYVKSDLVEIDQVGLEAGEISEEERGKRLKKGVYFKGFPQAAVDKIYKGLIGILESETSSMQDTVQKYFDSQGKEVIKRAINLSDSVFRGKKSLEADIIVSAIMRQIIGDKSSGVETWRSDTESHVRTFVRQSGDDMFASLGADGGIDMLETSIIKKIGERLVTTSNEVWDTTVTDLRKRVNNVITRGINAGKSIAELKDDVLKTLNKYYDDITEHRAGLIARTESQSMGNFGRMSAMEQNDFSFHTWATSADDRVRRGHADADGETVKIGEDFPVGRSGTYNGDKSFPSDMNERCITLPSTSP